MEIKMNMWEVLWMIVVMGRWVAGADIALVDHIFDIFAIIALVYFYVPLIKNYIRHDQY